jgi:hypothetical protein
LDEITEIHFPKKISKEGAVFGNKKEGITEVFKGTKVMQEVIRVCYSMRHLGGVM